MKSFLVTSVFGVLVVLGVPLFVLLGGLSFLLFGLYEPLPPEALIKYMLETIAKPALLSIPLYILLGAIMSRGKVAEHLVALMEAALGWLPGGLAVATVLACMAFGAISGSSPVTMVAIGSLMLPAMRSAGYPEALALGAVIVGGSLGILIPPSIPMIVFGIVTRTDIEKLFLASVVPGLVAGGGMMVVAVVWGWLARLTRKAFAFRALFWAFGRALPALGLPVLVLGGIYGGLYNVTEAATVAALYVFLLEALVYRELRWGALREALAEAATALGSIIVIVFMASLLSYFLILAELPFWVSDQIEQLNLQETDFLWVVLGLLLIAGLFMDTLSAILVLAPVLLPASQGLGISPILLGVLFIIALEIGYATPPVGLNLFVAMSYFKRSMGQVVRASVPFMLVLLVTAIILILRPHWLGI